MKQADMFVEIYKKAEAEAEKSLLHFNEARVNPDDWRAIQSKYNLKLHPDRAVVIMQGPLSEIYIGVQTNLKPGDVLTFKNKDAEKLDSDWTKRARFWKMKQEIEASSKTRYTKKEVCEFIMMHASKDSLPL